ncbi:MAG: DUF4435 domain-containing protein [Paludibacter sp.]|nr:DUF4435 domain-containing protein [Paludibacter sp.]
MTPTISENQHYEYWANYYAGVSIVLRYTASVHVEDFDDAVFWEKTLNHFLPEQKFNFVYYSLSPKGNETTGCEQCLKYKDYLSDRFFICIDSDYRYLLQESDISPSNHIYQTYTYSIENHLCFISKLNAIPEKCTRIADHIFDFEAFLFSYSNAVYEAYIWHLYFLRIGDETSFSKDEFNRIIHLLQVVPDYDIANNGNAIILEMENRCNIKINSLKVPFPDVNIELEKTYFRTLGVTSNNVYLFVRGHNLFDLIVAIGKKNCDKLLDYQKIRLGNNRQAVAQLYTDTIKYEKELMNEIVFGGYGEMEKIEKDLNHIL